VKYARTDAATNLTRMKTKVKLFVSYHILILRTQYLKLATKDKIMRSQTYFTKALRVKKFIYVQ